LEYARRDLRFLKTKTKRRSNALYAGIKIVTYWYFKKIYPSKTIIFLVFGFVFKLGN